MPHCTHRPRINRLSESFENCLNKAISIDKEASWRIMAEGQSSQAQTMYMQVLFQAKRKFEFGSQLAIYDAIQAMHDLNFKLLF
jgi:hypothetical protein